VCVLISVDARIVNNTYPPFAFDRLVRPMIESTLNSLEIK
jgi:hypothetical protein